MENLPSQKGKSGRWVWVAVIILVIIGVGVATQRELYLIGLIAPSGTSRFGSLDTSFTQPELLTWLHILPGTLYLLLATLQFVRPLRNKYPQIHRWCGRVAVIMGVIIGLTPW